MFDIEVCKTRNKIVKWEGCEGSKDEHSRCKKKQFEDCNQELNALNECFYFKSSDEEDDEEEKSHDNRETRVKQNVEEQNWIEGPFCS